jgi:ankyrin repeat protein
MALAALPASSAHSSAIVAQSPVDEFANELQHDSLDDVRAAIAHGLDPNSTTGVRRPSDVDPCAVESLTSSSGATLLSFALELKRFDIASLLIELGADVNKPDDSREGRRPLQTLARTTSSCHQAELNGVRTSRTLDDAAGEFAETLLTHGAALDARDGLGYSAIDYAALADNVPVLAALVAAGAPVDSRKPLRSSGQAESLDHNPFFGLPGATPLILAVHARARRATGWLVEHRANVNAATNDGLTPLLIAVAGADAEAITQLLDNGAKVNQAAPKMAPPYNLEPVLLAQYFVEEQSGVHPEFIDIVPLLTAHGAHLDLATRASNAVRRAYYHCCYMPLSH